MNSKPRVRHLARGFSLLEMLVVLLVLGVVSGGILSQMDTAVQRANTEQVKLDNVQETRDFADQFFRDVNQMGYPNSRMVDTTSGSWSPSLATPLINDNRFAIGLVKIDTSEVRFEGVTNGDDTVKSIVYKINGSGTCTSCLQRSQVDKVTADPLSGQSVSWGTAANDLAYTTVFSYFKADGTQVTALPVDISTGSGAQTIASIKTIKISLTIRNNAVQDLKTRQPLETTIDGLVSLNNCSMAASYDPSNAPMGCK